MEITSHDVKQGTCARSPCFECVPYWWVLRIIFFFESVFGITGSVATEKVSNSRKNNGAKTPTPTNVCSNFLGPFIDVANDQRLRISGLRWSCAPKRFSRRAEDAFEKRLCGVTVEVVKIPKFRERETSRHPRKSVVITNHFLFFFFVLIFEFLLYTSRDGHYFGATINKPFKERK